MEMQHLHLHFYFLALSLPTKKSCILIRGFCLISLLEETAMSQREQVR